MDFYQSLKHFHSGWAYMTVLFGVILLGLVIYFLATKKETTRMLRKVSFYTTLAFHIQFVVGIVLYFFLSPLGIKSSDAFYKFEHPAMMFTAVLFLTFANTKIKRSKIIKLPMVILVFIAMLLVFMMIPTNHTFGFLQGMIRG